MVAPTPSTPPLQGASSFTFDPRSRRYRDQRSGRFLSQMSVRAAVDTIIQKESANFREIAARLNAGQINLAEFQLQMAANVKRLHVAMELAANGGLKNTSPGDLGFIANLVKEQHKFLRGMAKDIKQGKQKLDGTLMARVELYAQSARGTHEKVRERAARIGGQTRQRSILGAADQKVLYSTFNVFAGIERRNQWQRNNRTSSKRNHSSRSTSHKGLICLTKHLTHLLRLHQQI